MAIADAAAQSPSPGRVRAAADLRQEVDDRLLHLLPEDGALLAACARETVLSPGKRVRPVLAMLAADYVGGRAEDALDFGCAVEMVHAASLVLDDLPCMDDAELRRGRPTLHRRHGEDAAILTAVALLNEATRVILRTPLQPEARLAAIDALTLAVGFEGLSQGQMRDLRDEPDERDATGLRQINDLKTGALFIAAVEGGARAGGGDPADVARLSAFGAGIGFAFQLCDDLLDAKATVEAVGKDVGQDADAVTFVDLWGENRVCAAVRQSLWRAADAVGRDSALADYVFDLFRHADIGV